MSIEYSNSHDPIAVSSPYPYEIIIVFMCRKKRTLVPTNLKRLHYILNSSCFIVIYNSRSCFPLFVHRSPTAHFNTDMPTTTKVKPRPYSCQNCPKSFIRRYELNNHMRVHTKETPFECPEERCSRKFRWRSCLRYHETRSVCTKDTRTRRGPVKKKPVRRSECRKRSSRKKEPVAVPAGLNKISVKPEPPSRASWDRTSCNPSTIVLQGNGTDGILIAFDDIPSPCDPLFLY